MLNKRNFLTSGLALALVSSAKASSPLIAPLKYYNQSQLVTSVMLNGQGPFSMAVSTSEPTNTIDQALVDALGLAKVHTMSKFFFGCELGGVGICDAQDIESHQTQLVGGFDLGKVIFAEETLRKAKDRNNFEALKNEDNFPRGILGAGIFLHKPCVLDFIAMQIRFYTQFAIEDFAGFSPVSGQIEGLHRDGEIGMYIWITIDGEKYKCLLDSSDTFDIYFPSQFVGENQILERFSALSQGKIVYVDKNASNNRTGKMYHGQLKGLNIGPHRIEDYTAFFGDPNHSDHLGNTILIGRGLLSQFHIAFTPERQVSLKPNAKFNAPRSLPSNYLGS